MTSKLSTHISTRTHSMLMRLTITVPDEIGEEVKERSGNVSAFVTEAIIERLDQMKRREARERIRSLGGTAQIKSSVYDTLHNERRRSDRS